MESLLVVLLGPTGSGKTTLSLTLARRFQSEIVSCDSVAVYREMEVGTAKPSPAERREIPHHLIDVLTPDQFCTAGDYARLARQSLATIVSCHHLPIVTGGTGLYLRALLEGLFRPTTLRRNPRPAPPQRKAAWSRMAAPSSPPP